MLAQENVLSESMMMVPETRQRLEAAYNDLQSFVVRMCAGLGVERCESRYAQESDHGPYICLRVIRF